MTKLSDWAAAQTLTNGCNGSVGKWNKLVPESSLKHLRTPRRRLADIHMHRSRFLDINYESPYYTLTRTYTHYYPLSMQTLEYNISKTFSLTCHYSKWRTVTAPGGSNEFIGAAGSTDTEAPWTITLRFTINIQACESWREKPDKT